MALSRECLPAAMELILYEFENLQKGTVSFVLSVCLSVRPSAWNKWPSAGWIFSKFWAGGFD
jgi:hypothetical protein